MFQFYGTSSTFSSGSVDLSHGWFNEVVNVCEQVDVVCGDHLLDHYQSLGDIQNSVGEKELQVNHTLNQLVPGSGPGLTLTVSAQDGLLVLHFGLVLPPQA